MDRYHRFERGELTGGVPAAILRVIPCWNGAHSHFFHFNPCPYDATVLWRAI